jgi:hypothetical protein
MLLRIPIETAGEFSINSRAAAFALPVRRDEGVMSSLEATEFSKSLLLLELN